MITGIGIDLTELERMRPHLDDVAFLRRVLTPEERECYQTLAGRRRAEFLAGRFAAKEAYAKARGTGIGRHVSLQDVSILNDPAGRPYVDRPPGGSERVHLSITHTDAVCAAFCVIESPSC